jgi:hypothetical protein
MNRLAFGLPVLLALSAAAQAQGQPGTTCPQLAADSGLTWHHKATANSDFCRALRADGSEAFGLYIADQTPFKPRRSDRQELASIDGHTVTWYRSELAAQPGVEARETLLELVDGRVAHIWIQARSSAELGKALEQAQAMRFQSARLSIK